MLRDHGHQEIISLMRSIDSRLAQIAQGVCNDELPPIHPDKAYTRQQAARLLSVSTWTIDHARKSGLLSEAERVGNRDVRIAGDSLVRFHRRRAAGARAKVQML